MIPISRKVCNEKKNDKYSRQEIKTSTKNSKRTYKIPSIIIVLSNNAYKIDGMSITISETVSISCNQNKIGKWPIIYMLNII